MIRVLLLCAFSLSACSVASECGGDTICDSEKDATVLLQSAVQTRDYEPIPADVQQITGIASTDQGLKANDAQVIELQNKQKAEVCWMRMPTGCNKALSETSTPTSWFKDPNGYDSATCTNRLGAFNNWCSRDDAVNHWGAASPPEATGDSRQKCSDIPSPWMTKTGASCKGRGSKWYKKRCYKKAWIASNICQQSCWDNEFGRGVDYCGPDINGCFGKNKTVCDALGDSCTWSGESCQIGCKTLGKPGTPKCPVYKWGGYCFWTRWTDVPVQRTFTSAERAVYDAQPFSCSPVIWSVGLGGGQSQDGKGPQKELSRPEFQVTEHYDTSEDKWVPCAGKSDCYYGARQNNIELILNNARYTHAAAEFSIDCAKGGVVEVVRWSCWWKLGRCIHMNDHIKVWYNLQPVMNDKRVGVSTRKVIPIGEADAYPIIRVETTRVNQKQTAYSLVRVRAFYAKAYFDSCMETKHRHGQCLKVLSLAQSNAKSSALPLLRMDHKMQLACMNGADKSSNCDAFLKCLKPESEKLIKTVIGGFGLVQTSQNLTHESPISGCKGGYAKEYHEEKATCKDPAAVDIEAVDCNCYEWVEGKTSDEIHAAICTDPDVCCYWKREHGCPGHQILLLEETQRTNTMTTRSHQQKDAPGAISLDDSLAGKRSCR